MIIDVDEDTNFAFARLLVRSFASETHIYTCGAFVNISSFVSAVGQCPTEMHISGSEIISFARLLVCSFPRSLVRSCARLLVCSFNGT